MFRKTAAPTLEYIFFALNRLQDLAPTSESGNNQSSCHQGIGLAHGAVRNIARGTALFFFLIRPRKVRAFFSSSKRNELLFAPII